MKLCQMQMKSIEEAARENMTKTTGWHHIKIGPQCLDFMCEERTKPVNNFKLRFVSRKILRPLDLE